jgi:triosephosphate isomerase
LKRNIPVLYGGSVNSQNAKNYIKEAKFQGLLIGGASLNPREFIKIIKSIDLISKI